jgi:hypothetical protein
VSASARSPVTRPSSSASGELAPLEVAVGEREVAEAEAEALVAHGLGGLAAERADLSGDLGDDVGDAGEVLLGEGELVHRLAALRLVFGDAGGLLEDDAALLGLGGEDLVDLALGHDRVARPADAGVHEKLVDVLQAAGLAVEEILALPVAVDAAHDLDLVEFAAELLFALGEVEGDLAELGGFAGVGALEDDVLHLAAAEGLGALLTEDPADGVGDVGFAAAVGADDGRDTGLELEGGVVRETFEPVKRERA